MRCNSAGNNNHSKDCCNGRKQGGAQLALQFKFSTVTLYLNGSHFQSYSGRKRFAVALTRASFNPVFARNSGLGSEIMLVIDLTWPLWTFVGNLAPLKKIVKM
jgi:hypothetical protein